MNRVFSDSAAAALDGLIAAMRSSEVKYAVLTEQAVNVVGVVAADATFVIANIPNMRPAMAFLDIVRRNSNDNVGRDELEQSIYYSIDSRRMQALALSVPTHS
jgi:hypothetical protein